MAFNLARRIDNAERQLAATSHRQIIILVAEGTDDATVDAFLAEHVGPIGPDDQVVRICTFVPRAETEPPVSLVSTDGLAPLLARIAENGKRLGGC